MMLEFLDAGSSFVPDFVRKKRNCFREGKTYAQLTESSVQVQHTQPATIIVIAVKLQCCCKGYKKDLDKKVA